MPAIIAWKGGRIGRQGRAGWLKQSSLSRQSHAWRLKQAGSLKPEPSRAHPSKPLSSPTQQTDRSVSSVTVLTKIRPLFRTVEIFNGKALATQKNVSAQFQFNQFFSFLHLFYYLTIMYSSQGITMAENYLDDMDPTLRFLPMGGQTAQSMAEFEAQLQAAMLQEQPQEMHPQILNLHNMDQLMPPPDLFNFDDFTAFNPQPPHKSYEHALPPQPVSVDYAPYIKHETSSSASSPSYDAVPDMPRAPLSPMDQQAATSSSAPSMTIPVSTPMPTPVSNAPSVTMPQKLTSNPATYEDQAWLATGTPSLSLGKI